MTDCPTVDGFADETSAVVVDAGPAAPVVHASISVRREFLFSALVMRMRMRSVETAAKVTVRLTRLFPATVATLTQAAPVQRCTWKSVTPYWAKVMASVGATGASQLSWIE